MKRILNLLNNKSFQLAVFGIAFLCLYAAIHTENTALGNAGLLLTVGNTVLIALPQTARKA